MVPPGPHLPDIFFFPQEFNIDCKKRLILFMKECCSYCLDDSLAWTRFCFLCTGHLGVQSISSLICEECLQVWVQESDRCVSAFFVVLFTVLGLLFSFPVSFSLQIEAEGEKERYHSTKTWWGPCWNLGLSHEKGSTLPSELCCQRCSCLQWLSGLLMFGKMYQFHWTGKMVEGRAQLHSSEWRPDKMPSKCSPGMWRHKL